MYVSSAKVNSVVLAHTTATLMGSFPFPMRQLSTPPPSAQPRTYRLQRSHLLPSVSPHIYNTGNNHSNWSSLPFLGYHPDLRINRKDTTRELNLELRGHPSCPDRPRSCVLHPRSRYRLSPQARITTQAVFTETFKKIGDITAIDVKTNLDEISTQINWNTIYNPLTKAVPVGAKLKQFNQLGKAFLLGVGASGLALRMGIILPGDEAQVVVALRRFITQLKLLKNVPNGADYQELADLLATLLLSQKITTASDSQIQLVLDTKVYTVTSVEGVRKRLVDAWGANAFGRFCAEPKGLHFARNISLIPDAVSGVGLGNQVYNFSQKGALQGQLAFCVHGYIERRNFQPGLFVYGSSNDDKNPGHGAYMKPCTSCAARSTGMMSGLLPAVLDLAAPGGGVGFNWMSSSESQLISELQRRYPGPLNYTSAQVLAGVIIAKRRTFAVPPPNPEELYISLIRAEALRMKAIRYSLSGDHPPPAAKLTPQ